MRDSDTNIIDELCLSSGYRRTILRMIDSENAIYKDLMRKGVTGIAVHRRRVHALNKVLQMAEAYERLAGGGK